MNIVAKYCTKCGTEFNTANYCPVCGYCRYTNFLPQSQVYVQQRSGIGWFVFLPIGLIIAVIPYLWILVPFIIIAIVLVAVNKPK